MPDAPAPQETGSNNQSSPASDTRRDQQHGGSADTP